MTKSLTSDLTLVMPFTDSVFSSVLPVVRASSSSNPEKRTTEDWDDQYVKSAGHPDDFTPKERLRQTWASIWERTDWEYDLISMTGHATFVAGFIIGAMARNEENRLTSIRRNSEVQFDHPYLARRKMTDQQYLQNVKNGFKFGWRTSLFSVLLCTGSLSVLSYRNYVNPLDFVAAFGAVGGMWKWQKGPKGMVAGASICGSFGLLFGCLVWSIVKVSGVSVAEFRVKMGGAMLHDHTKSSQGFLSWCSDDPAIKFLLDREMTMQQRLYQERMAQHEAQLLAKQMELADAVQKTK